MRTPQDVYHYKNANESVRKYATVDYVHPTLNTSRIGREREMKSNAIYCKLRHR